MAAALRIGFIGLGKMGRPMARRLADAGYRLGVADARAEAASEFAGRHGAETPPTLFDLGRQSDLLITMLPAGGAVREVVLGDEDDSSDCVAKGLAPGSVVIDMSSSAPVGTRDLGQRLDARGVAMLDAPVSGGVARAEDGTLAIMVGGEAPVIGRCRAVLEAMGREIFLTGPLGSGHAMKALNNYVSAAGLLATCEALLIGQRFGLDAERMVEVLNASSGRNNSTENKFKQFILPRTFASGFSLGLMAKDLRTAAELAAQTRTSAPLMDRCAELWEEAQRKLGDGVDHTAIVRIAEQESGEELKIPDRR